MDTKQTVRPAVTQVDWAQRDKLPPDIPEHSGNLDAYLRDVEAFVATVRDAYSSDVRAKARVRRRRNFRFDTHVALLLASHCDEAREARKKADVDKLTRAVARIATLLVMRDTRMGRDLRRRSKEGGAAGAESMRAKVPIGRNERIRKAFSQGCSQKEIAEANNLSTRQVRRIIRNGRT